MKSIFVEDKLMATTPLQPARREGMIASSVHSQSQKNMPQSSNTAAGPLLNEGISFAAQPDALMLQRHPNFQGKFLSVSRPKVRARVASHYAN